MYVIQVERDPASDPVRDRWIISLNGQPVACAIGRPAADAASWQIEKQEIEGNRCVDSY